MGDAQRHNLEVARAFYAAGPMDVDEYRRQFFASDFVWHVPGDTDLSGDYSGDAYFTEMPARMQPLDEWQMDLDSLAANRDLVVAVGRVRGTRLGRKVDTTAGHVLRFDDDAHIVEAWGWASDQSALDEFFARR